MVHVGGVRVLVVVLAEPMKGDQQQLVEALPPGMGWQLAQPNRTGSSNAKALGPVMSPVPHTLTLLSSRPAPTFSLFFNLQLIKVHIDNSAPALLWIRTPGA